MNLQVRGLPPKEFAGLFSERALRKLYYAAKMQQEFNLLQDYGARDPKVEREIQRAAPSVIQNSTFKQDSGAGGSTTSNTINSVTAGRCLVALVMWEAGTASLSSVSDGTNSYTVASNQATGGAGGHAAVAVAPNVSSGNFAATATFSNSTAEYRTCILVECADIATVTPIDASAGAHGNTASPSSGNMTASSASSLLIGGTKAFAGVSLSSWMGGSGTELMDWGDGGAGYQVLSATGTYAVSATYSSANDWGMAGVILLGAASGGTGNLSATIPGFTAALTGTAELAGTLSATIPGYAAAFTGTVPITGNLAATIPGYLASLASQQEILGNLAATIPGLTAALTGNAPIDGQLAAVIPVFITLLEGDLAISGNLNATIPGFSARLSESERKSLAVMIHRRLLYLLTEDE